MNQLLKQSKIIYKIKTGSFLYGTNTKDSDEDYIGVFIAPIDYYLGMKQVNEIDESIKSKTIDNKNTKDAVDCKYYEIRQYFKLLFDNNPNIVETIFCNKENILYEDTLFRKVLKYKDCFLSSKLIKQKFLGYAFSQKKKMIVKLENYDILKEAYDILNDSKQKFLVDEINFNKFEFRNNINTEFRVGDIFIPRNVSIKRAKEILQTRLGRVGNRQELILKYGFDTKFSSHLIRLLFECEELLTYKKITFTLKDKELITDIKQGKYKLNEVLELAEEIEQTIENIKYNKFERGFDVINNLLILILEENFNL